MEQQEQESYMSRLFNFRVNQNNDKKKHNKSMSIDSGTNSLESTTKDQDDHSSSQGSNPNNESSKISKEEIAAAKEAREKLNQGN